MLLVAASRHRVTIVIVPMVALR
jgi:superfamily II DNA helicase RecQ